ncbi:acyl-CoA thioesterase [Aurantiacibacter luteus]|uniref:Acyl-CoA thioesterase n=1 Tax=Aurantiacibacter luteus TaxID=1581420 RepID=A0A0G9MTA3_9SPHN|nr:acyl-CoA thioesterase domain-containing protein [Aurantiacibacter luteus]KLE33955.1 hypothetical protein AAW00_06430 [Aurantiacibacter luteus]
MTAREPIAFPALLALERVDEKTFTGMPGPGIGPRMFGGHALAQALMAAGLSLPEDRHPHSLHVNFLAPGGADAATLYRVATLREGRSFSTLRIDALQGERTVLTMTVSAQVAEEGFAHAAQMPQVADLAAARRALEDWQRAQADFETLPIIGRLTARPVDVVPIDVAATFGDTPRPPRSACWMRVRKPEGMTIAMQRSAMAYASDMLFLRNALLPHGVRPGEPGIQIASLDHAMWFHEEPDFGRWHLYAGESPWAGHARGLSRGHFFAADGALVASVAQENLMRVTDGRLARAGGVVFENP